MVGAHARPSKRQASCSFPDATDTISPRRPTITFSFDVTRYDRGSGACHGQAEGGDSDAVFLLQQGAGLSNDVCEDAITIKQSCGTSTIRGGGALHAEDKVVQYNGGGTPVVVEDFLKLYRSGGNCEHSHFSNIIASDGGALVKRPIVSTDDVDSICDTYEGNDTGAEPPKLTSNEPNVVCQF
ncbi:pectin lyase-like protein [Hymenopellis radicata]|nr:pectin lyase-like protein [Hymenopellis radicata]